MPPLSSMHRAGLPVFWPEPAPAMPSERARESRRSRPAAPPAPVQPSAEVVILRALRAAASPRERQRLQADLLRVGEWTPRIRALARRWQCPEITLEEFVQAGLQGVLEAAQRYDGRPTGWPTYATSWARRRIQELARAQQGPVVAETQWERRIAERTGAARRAAGWSLVEAPRSDDDDRGRYSEVCAAAGEMQAAHQDETEHAAMLARIGAAAAELPPLYRAALALELGEAPTVRLSREERARLKAKALRWLRRRVFGQKYYM